MFEVILSSIFGHEYLLLYVHIMQFFSLHTYIVHTYLKYNFETQLPNFKLHLNQSQLSLNCSKGTKKLAFKVRTISCQYTAMMSFFFHQNSATSCPSMGREAALLPRRDACLPRSLSFFCEIKATWKKMSQSFYLLCNWEGKCDDKYYFFAKKLHLDSIRATFQS